MREDLSTGDMWEYQYDVMGNLLHVETPGGESIEYLVDARNRRIGKRVNGSLHQAFLYRDQLNPVAELDGAGNVVSRFVYGSRGHVPDYMVRSGVTYRLVSDHLGSVVAVINVANWQIVQKREYDTWGRILSETTAPGFSQPFGFAGGFWDEETGLVRFGARDYDPETARWNSLEPLGFAGGSANLYGYAYGDPVNLIDPDGLTPSDWASGFGDTLSFGLTGVVRRGLGIDDVVDRCSSAFSRGELLGVAHSLAFGAGHLGRNALRQATRRRSGVGRPIYDNRTWDSVRRTWSGSPPILRDRGQNLHHWLIPQRRKSIPQGIRNAGFNYFPLSARFNSWMNGSTIGRIGLEWGLKGVVGGTYGAPLTYGTNIGACGC